MVRSVTAGFNYWSEDMRFIYLLVIVLLFSIQFQASEIPTEIQVEQYWKGTLIYKEQAWDVGILIESGTEAKFYSETFLRSGVKAEGFSRNGKSISFGLPFKLGAFTGSLRNGIIVGEVRLANGAKEHLRLSPAILKKVRKKEISLKNGDVEIAATLTLPEKKGVYPVAVILHGGGDSSRESPAYAFFGDYFAKNGIACLTYDKRGNGKSTGNWRTVGFDERAGDVIAALGWLKRHKEIDSQKMGLVGVSQGTWVAGIVADKSSDVRFAVNVVGPLVTPFEADTYAQKYRLRKNGWSLNDIKEYLHLWKLETDYIRKPQTGTEWTKLQEAIVKTKDSGWFRNSPYQTDKNSWFYVWYKEILDHDPMPILRRSDVPMLWIYGNRDSQSDFARNMGLLSELKREGKLFDVEVISDVGHGLLGPVDEDGHESILLATPDSYLRSMLRWLKER